MTKDELISRLTELADECVDTQPIGAATLLVLCGALQSNMECELHEQLMDFARAAIVRIKAGMP